MKSLIISDIHANLAGLEAVLEHERSWDEVIFVGDAVVAGPQPEQVVRRLRELQGVWIMGNHDVEAIEPPREANPANPDDVYMQWTRSQLSEESRSFLASFRDSATITRAGSSISLTHGWFPHPLGPLGLPTRLLRGKLRRAGRAYRKVVFPHWSSRIWPDTHDSVFRSIRRTFPADIIIVAHSHVQFDRNVGGARFINPGSVGQPRLGQPLATYVVIENDEFQCRGVPYDFEATCAALEAVPVDASFKRIWKEAYRAGRVPDRYAIREWDSLIEAGYR